MFESRLGFVGCCSGSAKKLFVFLVRRLCGLRRDRPGLRAACTLGRNSRRPRGVMRGLPEEMSGLRAFKRLCGIGWGSSRCLRRCLGIPPSYWSRVSNADILERARATQLSSTLLKRQLRLFGRIALQPPGDPLRALLFVDDGLNFGPLDGPHRRGRPAQYLPEMVR